MAFLFTLLHPPVASGHSSNQ